MRVRVNQGQGLRGGDSQGRKPQGYRPTVRMPGAPSLPPPPSAARLGPGWPFGERLLQEAPQDGSRLEPAILNKKIPNA